MSNRLFAATGAIRHCGPKRVKRTWGSTVCTVLMLLALAALTGWLWHCVKHATLPRPARVPGVAMAPVTQGMVMGALLSLSAMGIVLAVRKIARNDQDAATRWSVKKSVGADPLESLGQGIDLEKMRRVLGALIVEGCEVRNAVLLANRDGSVEDYGDRLAGVARRLHGMVLCQAHLSDGLALESPKWKVDDLLRGQQLVENEAAMVVELMAIRATWLRPYSAPAARHRPAHGGYAS